MEEQRREELLAGVIEELGGLDAEWGEVLAVFTERCKELYSKEQRAEMSLRGREILWRMAEHLDEDPEKFIAEILEKGRTPRDAEVER